MVSPLVALTFGNFIIFLLAVIIRREFEPKHLTAAELGAQMKMAHDLVAYALRGAPVTGEDVEDLTQDVMLAAWEASEDDRYRPDPAAPPERALQGWLRAIAHHLVDHYRDATRLRREVLMAEPPQRPDIAPTAELILETEQERTEMLAAMQDLPPGQRHVIIAHDLEEETMAEIADHLGIPLSTLYKWRARGHAALVKALRARAGLRPSS